MPLASPSKPFLTELLESLPTHWWEKPATSTAGNWNWRPGELSYSPDQEEVKLEREIVAACGLEEWTFQMSTMSGLLSSTGHKRRAIDLVHRVGPDHYEFIELKVASNNPVSAAFEVLSYGLAYYRARQHPTVNSGSGRHNVLLARKIELVVLAPKAWYEYEVRGKGAPTAYDVAWLSELLNGGLADLSEALKLKGLESLTFEFRAFENPQQLLDEVRRGDRPGRTLV
jgi:hypothetical protein